MFIKLKDKRRRRRKKQNDADRDYDDYQDDDKSEYLSSAFYDSFEETSDFVPTTTAALEEPLSIEGENSIYYSYEDVKDFGPDLVPTVANEEPITASATTQPTYPAHWDPSWTYPIPIANANAYG